LAIYHPVSGGNGLSISLPSQNMTQGGEFEVLFYGEEQINRARQILSLFMQNYCFKTVNIVTIDDSCLLVRALEA